MAEKYNSIDLIQYIRQLYTRFRIDGIKKKARGISGGKNSNNKIPGIKFADTSNRGQVCLFSKQDDGLIVMQNVQFDFR